MYDSVYLPCNQVYERIDFPKARTILKKKKKDIFAGFFVRNLILYFVFWLNPWHIELMHVYKCL